MQREKSTNLLALHEEIQRKEADLQENQRKWNERTSMIQVSGIKLREKVTALESEMNKMQAQVKEYGSSSRESDKGRRLQGEVEDRQRKIEELKISLESKQRDTARSDEMMERMSRRVSEACLERDSAIMAARDLLQHMEATKKDIARVHQSVEEVDIELAELFYRELARIEYLDASTREHQDLWDRMDSQVNLLRQRAQHLLLDKQMAERQISDQRRDLQLIKARQEDKTLLDRAVREETIRLGREKLSKHFQALATGLQTLQHKTDELTHDVASTASWMEVARCLSNFETMKQSYQRQVVALTRGDVPLELPAKHTERGSSEESTRTQVGLMQQSKSYTEELIHKDDEATRSAAATRQSMSCLYHISSQSPRSPLVSIKANPSTCPHGSLPSQGNESSSWMTEVDDDYMRSSMLLGSQEMQTSS